MKIEEQQLFSNIKKSLMQSQHQSVITQCSSLLSPSADENGANSDTGLSAEAKREALYLLAVAYRLSGSTQNAISTLDNLVALFPDYGRAFQELGYCYLKVDDKKAAHSFYLSLIHI